jgi:hypothetical protein
MYATNVGDLCRDRKGPSILHTTQHMQPRKYEKCVEEKPML